MQRLLLSTTGSRKAQNQKVHPLLREVGLRFRSTVLVVFVFSFFVNLLMLSVPIYLLQIYDKVLPNRSFDSLLFLSTMVVVALLVMGVLDSARTTIMSRLGVRIDRLLSDPLLSSSITRAVRREVASANVLRDLSSLRSFLSGTSLFPLLDVPWTPLFVIILYWLHPALGLIALGGVLVLVALALYNEYSLQNRTRETDAESVSMLDEASSYLRHADAVKAMGMEAGILERWRERNESQLENSYRANRLSARLRNMSRMLRTFLQVAIIATAAWLILNHQLSPGATIASILLFRRAISPLEQVISSWKQVMRTRHGLSRINAALVRAEKLESNAELPDPQGVLAVRKVAYRRKNERKPVFSRVTLTVKPGQLAVIHGSIAAGKSTLIRVLAGVLPPTEGRISLGGFELAQWPAEQLGRAVGYLPQEPSLFPVTVRENIARFTDAPIAEVIKAAEKAQAHDMIQRLPDGYDTLVNEDASNLSGGQRQKVALARALFGSPRLVLLDEPDANLDSDSRKALQKMLLALREEDVVVICISHQSAMRKIADKVYRIEDGKLYKATERGQETLSEDQSEEGVGEEQSPAIEMSSVRPALVDTRPNPSRRLEPPLLHATARSDAQSSVGPGVAHRRSTADPLADVVGPYLQPRFHGGRPDISSDEESYAADDSTRSTAAQTKKRHVPMQLKQRSAPAANKPAGSLSDVSITPGPGARQTTRH